MNSIIRDIYKALCYKDIKVEKGLVYLTSVDEQLVFDPKRKYVAKSIFITKYLNYEKFNSLTR